jgi:hypothetical protein
LQAAIRYQIRLQNIHAEILAMQDDYYRDRTTATADSYLFPYAHLMRSEDLQLQRQSIEDEIDRVAKIIEVLSQCPQGCQKTRLQDLKKVVGQKKTLSCCAHPPSSKPPPLMAPANPNIPLSMKKWNLTT